MFSTKKIFQTVYFFLVSFLFISCLTPIYKDIQIELVDVNDYTKLVFKDKVNIVTPGMNRVFGDPYVITIERVIPYA